MIDSILSNIKKERLRLQYSQEYMAMKLNRSQNAYSKIELGRSKITVEQLIKIADLLNVEVTQLLNLKANNNPLEL